MKKIICLILAMLICFSLCGCKNEARSEYPLRQIDVVYDKYGNILQQTLYNDNTGDYTVKEYRYALYNNKWVCIDQSTTIITQSKEDTNYTQTNNQLNIYYRDDLFDRPLTLIDNNMVRVSITKYLEADYWYDFAYELKVENKSNKVLTVSIEDPAIMSINCRPMFSIDHINAGNTAYFTLGWDEDTLKRCYIPYINNVEFMVKVYDNENWKAPAFAGERVMIKHN